MTHDIARIMKSKRRRLVGFVAWMERQNVHAKLWWLNLFGKVHLENRQGYECDNIKMDLGEVVGCGEER
jgi:hypothetical protein